MSYQRLSGGFVFIVVAVLIVASLFVVMRDFSVRQGLNDVPNSFGISFAQGNAVPHVQSPRFVNERGAALDNQPLRLLCYPAASASAPSADLLLTSNSEGRAKTALPTDCSYVAALQILHTQPSGKLGRDIAYTVYATSWSPGTRNLSPVSSDVVINRQRTLVLFDVAVSLEWQESAARTHSQQLRDGMRSASAYLYDLSDGQVAFGALSFSDSGTAWEAADLRIRAANDYRPSARVGGMVANATSYTTPTGIQTVYQPGEILLPRWWDGNSADNPVTGAWSKPAAYRTLAHEWLHYALFLYDAYQDLDDDGRQETYCTCNDLPQLAVGSTVCAGINPESAASAMAYHYVASELWLSGLPASCVGTDQHKVHGEADWQTVERWSAIQGLNQQWLRAPTQTITGPDLGLVADLFDRTPTPLASTDNQVYLPIVSSQDKQTVAQAANPTLTDTEDVTISLAIRGAALSLAALNQFQMQIYTIEPAINNLPARIVHQGASNFNRTGPNQLGSIQILGVGDATKIYVSASRVATSSETSSDLLYHGSLPMTGDPSIVLDENPWQAKLKLTPVMSGTRLGELTVDLSSLTALSVTPTVRICSPERGIGCNSAWQSSFTLTSIQNSLANWTANLRAADNRPLPHFGYLHVIAPGVGEIIRWFQMAGGVGPAHMFGEAPLRDGLVMVDSAQPLTGTPNLVFIAPADTQTLIQSPLPPGSRGLVSLPLDVSVLLPTTEQSRLARQGRNGEATLPVPVVMTFFYNRSQFSQLGISNSSAHLVYFDDVTGQWLPAPAASQSSTLGWITTPPQRAVGTFAVVELPQPNLGQEVALITESGPIQPQVALRAMIILPANPALSAPASGAISYTVPSSFEIAQQPVCNFGDCVYDEAVRIFKWAGQIDPHQPAVMIIAIKQGDPSLCQPTLIHNASAFDGQQPVSLDATTVYICPSPSSTPSASPLATTVTATPTPSPTPSSTPSSTALCQGASNAQRSTAAPTCTTTPSQTPTAAATSQSTSTVVGQWVSGSVGQ